MDIYGSHFEYDGVSSRDYGLIIVNLNTERYLSVGGEGVASTVFNAKANKRYIIDSDESNSPVEFDIEIITDTQRSLFREEVIEISSWLFNKKSYKKLYFDMADDTNGETFEIINGEVKRLYMNCRFVNPEKIERDGSVVGFKVTIETDSNMFWQDPIEEVLVYNHKHGWSGSSKIITIDTDYPGYTLPVVTVLPHPDMAMGGRILIRNSADLDGYYEVNVKYFGKNATVTMDSSIRYIGGTNVRSDYNPNFLRLLSGENRIVVGGAMGSLKVKYQNRRFF